MPSVRELVDEIKLRGLAAGGKRGPFRGRLVLDEPMRDHTSFRIGGPADLYAAPADVEELASLRELLARAAVPVFLLGGGTNLLVADRGIRGAVIDLASLAGVAVVDRCLEVGAGEPINSAAEAALRAGLAGLEWAASLPGSVGGAAWMNARCYDREMADVLGWIDVLEAGGAVRRRPIEPSAWGYKRSPFQASNEVIIRACFRLAPGDARSIAAAMAEHRDDRRRKGHFLHPCAGSVFKNDRSFGAPTGKIIDEAGLKGLRIGAAAVAPFHGNIIINLGGATAAEVRSLIERVEAEIERRRGLRLEREVLLVGDWGSVGGA